MTAEWVPKIDCVQEYDHAGVDRNAVRDTGRPLQVMNSSSTVPLHSGISIVARAVAPVQCVADVDRARRQARELVVRLGCTTFDAILIATVVSELGRAIVTLNIGGAIAVDGKRNDHSAEIAIQACFHDRIYASAANRNGSSLETDPWFGIVSCASIKSVVDELEVIRDRAGGTTIVVKKRIAACSPPLSCPTTYSERSLG